MPYLRENVLSWQISHVCTVTGRASMFQLPIYILRSNLSVHSTIVHSWNTTIEEKTSELAHHFAWQCLYTYRTNSGWCVCLLVLRRVLASPPPIFPWSKSPRLWSHLQDEITAWWHLLPYHPTDSAGCKLLHLKNQQNRCCQWHPVFSRMLTTLTTLKGYKNFTLVFLLYPLHVHSSIIKVLFYVYWFICNWSNLYIFNL